MLKAFSFSLLLLLFQNSFAQQMNFNDYPVYTGTDLGLNYTPHQSTFRIWAPSATAAEIIFYKEGIGGTSIQTVALDKSINGTWYTVIKENLKGQFYTFRIQYQNHWLNEVPDRKSVV